MKTLVIVAHPDDEVLGCGGNIARMVDNGHHVAIAIMGEGITSRYDGENRPPPQLVKELHSQSRKAAKLLGVEDIYFYNLPDNCFDTVPLLEIVKKIEELLNSFKPTVVYTHHGCDLNIDHIILHRAVLTATRPTINQTVKFLYTFEVPSSTEWSFNQFHPPFSPNVFVDISDTIEKKVDAMDLYDTEKREYPHPRSAVALKAISKKWGSTVGVPAAEAFQLVRAIY